MLAGYSPEDEKKIWCCVWGAWYAEGAVKAAHIVSKSVLDYYTSVLEENRQTVDVDDINELFNDQAQDLVFSIQSLILESYHHHHSRTTRSSLLGLGECQL